MEASNQFLEENATTYGIEQENEKISEDVVYVYSGEALELQDVFRFSCVENINPVIVTGEHESGKTTLEVMIYRLFLEGKNEKLMFAGSVTLKGFQERSRKLLKKSGAKKPDVQRTLWTEKKFLHLALCNKKDKKRKNLIFADYAGELFDDATCLEELGNFFEDVSNVVITLDGKKLCKYEERKAVILHAKVLLSRMHQVGILSKHTHLYIVCTKFDEVKKSKDKDMTMKFLERNYEILCETFKEKVRKMDLVYLCAYGINEKEEKEKMEKMLLEFVEENSKNDQIEMKQQVEIKRQMDKFEARG